jgi:predicted nucleic acid-binding protein
MQRIYIETSVFSYLTARPSSNVIAAARQQITTEWWNIHRMRYNLFTSILAEIEASRGDSNAAKNRLSAINGIPYLEITPSVTHLAEEFLIKNALPKKAQDDATHVALAAVHEIDDLSTWNCRHIDNAEMKPLIRSICNTSGFDCPEICTPEELFGVQT